MLDLHKKTVEGKLYVFRVVFPTKRDSATFWDKGTTGQAQNLAMGRAGTACQNPGQDAGWDNHYFSVKIWDRTIFFL